MTHADIIRSMSDERLAAWLTFVEIRILERNPRAEESNLYEDWLNWLSQEVKENE